MKWYDKIAAFLHWEMEEAPGNYGWFHIMMLAVIISLTVIFCVYGKNCTDKTFRRIILYYWIYNIISELYVALIYSFELEGGVGVWDYEWYMFPFQFCSSPAYTLPFIAFLKDGRVRDAFISFTGTFSLFAGIAVMLYPNDVFVKCLGIDIQTMIHHGMQVVLGVFVMVHERRRLTHSFFFKGIPVFAGLVLIAMGLNIGVYHLFSELGMDDTFNMYFISPYFDCTLPILSLIYPLIPYPAFLVMYILGFSLIAALMYYVQRAIILKVTGIAPHILRGNYERPLYHERLSGRRC